MRNDIRQVREGQCWKKKAFAGPGHRNVCAHGLIYFSRFGGEGPGAWLRSVQRTEQRVWPEHKPW